jgi:hypothetical protein
MSDISSARHGELAEMLRERVGDNLRAVRVVTSTEDGGEYEHLFIREDIEEMYDEEDMKRITDEVIYHTLGEGYRSNLFHSGEPNYTAYVFDEAVVLLFYEDDAHGTAVSVDSGFEGGIRELATDCLDILNPQSKI